MIEIILFEEGWTRNELHKKQDLKISFTTEKVWNAFENSFFRYKVVYLGKPLQNEN